MMEKIEVPAWMYDQKARQAAAEALRNKGTLGVVARILGVNPSTLSGYVFNNKGKRGAIGPEWLLNRLQELNAIDPERIVVQGTIKNNSSQARPEKQRRARLGAKKPAPPESNGPQKSKAALKAEELRRRQEKLNAFRRIAEKAAARVDQGSRDFYDRYVSVLNALETRSSKMQPFIRMEFGRMSVMNEAEGQPQTNFELVHGVDVLMDFPAPTLEEERFNMACALFLRLLKELEEADDAGSRMGEAIQKGELKRIDFRARIPEKGRGAESEQLVLRKIKRR
jgi:hypothetical protein